MTLDNARVNVILERIHPTSGELHEHSFGRIPFGEVRNMLLSLKDNSIEYDDRVYTVQGARWKGTGDTLTVILELR